MTSLNKTFLKSLVVGSLLSALVACASGGGSDTATTPGQTGLVDESGLVEVVQGEDPRRYFIANGPALNAVDADKDGIWDDVQARLATSSAVQNVDPGAVKQLVQYHQGKLFRKTVAEAKVNPNGYSLARGCFFYRETAKGTPRGLAHQRWDELNKAVSAALFVSKERVLASEYADALASGGSFSAAPETESSCR